MCGVAGLPTRFLPAMIFPRMAHHVSSCRVFSVAWARNGAMNVSAVAALFGRPVLLRMGSEESFDNPSILWPHCSPTNGMSQKLCRVPFAAVCACLGRCAVVHVLLCPYMCQRGVTALAWL